MSSLPDNLDVTDNINLLVSKYSREGKYKELQELHQKLEYFYNEFSRLSITEKKDSREVVKQLYELVDIYIREDRPKTATCSKGCSYCCSIHVSATSAEAEYLSQFVTDEMKPKLERQSKVSFDKWLDQDLEDQKCIFLKDNECSIYEHRPASCRLHFVQSNPELCNPSTKQITERIMITTAEIVYTAFMNLYGQSSIAPLLNRYVKSNG